MFKLTKDDSANFLSSFGGGTLTETVKRILRFLISDSVASNFSWLGRKNKRVFSSLRTKIVIFKAVRMNSLFKGAKDKEIVDIIKNWLRPAKFRLSSKKLKPTVSDEQE